MLRVRPFPPNPRYHVREDGVVLGLSGKPLRPAPQIKRGGYLAVSLWTKGRNRGKTWKVHVMVALTFIGPKPSPKHEVAHWDGVKTNNWPKNLRWATRVDNHKDRVRHGVTNRGERSAFAKHSEAFVITVKRALKKGGRNVDHARRFGVKPHWIAGIKCGRRWGHVVV